MARILIVEDEGVVAWNLQESLEYLGHQIIGVVESGLQAIQVAAANPLDLALMDIRLAGEQDGIETAAQLRHQFGIPIVYLTALTDAQTLERAVATDPFGYLIKPFSRRELQTTIDIALRRYSLEKHLETTGQWLQTTLNSIGDGTIATDSEGTIVFMNSVAEILTGWARSDALGQFAPRVFHLVHAQTGETVENPILRCLREGTRVVLPDNCLLRARDGQERLIGDSAAPILKADGEIVGGVLIFQDITERKRAEIALQAQAEQLEQQVQERTHQLQQTMEQLQQALSFEALLKRITDRVRDSLDEDHILQTVVQELGQGLGVICCDTAIYNDAEQSTFTIRYEYNQGLPTAQGRTFVTGASPHVEVHRQLQRGLYSQFCFITPHIVRPGQQLGAILTCPIIDDREFVLGNLWLFKPSQAVFEDPEIRLVQQVANQCAIALRQARLYRNSQQQIQELAQLNQLKDDFLNTISHELRTPIANIKMAAEMLQIRLRRAGLLESDTSLSNYLRILQEQCNQEMSLINDLLDLSQLEEGGKSLALTPINLAQWLPALLQAFADRMERQQQQLQLHIPADLPLLMTDQDALTRIFTELIDNACKYTPIAGRIHITAEVIPGEVAPDSPTATALQICITNTGVEIPLPEQARVFEKFYRIANNDPYRYRGTGLGLALVKKLVERLQGTITVSSGNEQTTFVLLLPLLPNT